MVNGGNYCADTNDSYVRKEHSLRRDSVEFVINFHPNSFGQISAASSSGDPLPSRPPDAGIRAGPNR